jgi:hypothetical protein
VAEQRILLSSGSWRVKTASLMRLTANGPAACASMQDARHPFRVSLRCFGDDLLQFVFERCVNDLPAVYSSILAYVGLVVETAAAVQSFMTASTLWARDVGGIESFVMIQAGAPHRVGQELPKLQASTLQILLKVLVAGRRR